MSDNRGTTTLILPRLFVGFEYQDPYRQRYGERVRDEVTKVMWQAIMPLGESPDGILLDRIDAMIRSTKRAVFEVGHPNPNVWFEIGVAAILRIPVALTTDVEPTRLPDIIRGAWLRFYSGDEGCASEVLAFLGQADRVLLHKGGEPIGADPLRAVVIGSGSRAEAVGAVVAAAGYSVTLVSAPSIGTLPAAIGLAELASTIVLVRPPGEGSWPGEPDIGAFVALGAAYGLRRTAVIAAGTGETIPSDCLQLVARGHEDAEVAARVRGVLEAPRPDPPPTGTRRPQLVGSLARPLARTVAQTLTSARAAFLVAEPGYGKTTVAEQAAGGSGAPVAWLTVDRAWSLAEFLEALVAAVGAHAPGFGWSALAAVRRLATSHETPQTPTGPEQETPDPIALLLTDIELAFAPETVVLVIDNVHLLSNVSSRAVAGLIHDGPPWLRVVAAGRGIPNSLKALTALGLVPAWHADELKFTAGETQEFLRKAQPGLPEAHIGVLHRATNGWPAALSVVRAWLLAHPDTPLDQLRARVRGDRHEIYQTFATEYFTELAVEIREDLFKAALPPVLGLAEAHYLFGDAGGVKVRQLAEGPHFLVQEETGDYRFHGLFQEFLLRRWAEEKGLRSLRAEQVRLARWYLERKQIVEAYELACTSEDWDTAKAAITPVAGAIANQGDGHVLREILAKMPVEVIRSSRELLQSWVRALSYVGDPTAIEEAKRLVALKADSPGEDALASLLLIELRYERGELSEVEMGDASDLIADRLGSADLSMVAQARYQSVSVRGYRSADPAVWSALYEEAVAVAELAEVAGQVPTAAGALALASDLLHRLFQSAMSRGALSLQLQTNLGVDVPLEVRAAAARHVLNMSRQSLELLKRAEQLAAESEDQAVKAQVRLIASRLRAESVMNQIFLSKQLDEDGRAQAETAIGLALSAAATYAELGMVRNLVIAINAAGQAATIIGDTKRRDELLNRSEQLATDHGYLDLARSARNIRIHPTPLEAVEEAMRPRAVSSMTDGEREQFISQSMVLGGVPPNLQSQLRPVLERVFDDDAFEDDQQLAFCRYLKLFYYPTESKIGPFDADHPWRRATCRLLGSTAIVRARQGKPLLKSFKSAVCAKCSFRSPAVTPENLSRDDEDFYEPLRQLIDGDAAS